MHPNHERMAEILARIVGQAKPNRHGYDSSLVALDGEWRESAREALKEYLNLEA